MRTTPIRVVIADEHDIFKIGFKAAVKNAPGIEVVGEADTSTGLLSQLEALQPDVLFMDLAMLTGSGVSTLIKVRQSSPATKILLLGYELDTLVVDKLSKAGANGFLSKAAETTDVERAIRMVMSQGFFFSDAEKYPEVESVFRPVTLSPQRTSSSLTNKEVTVLRLICQELSTRDIASSLSLSPRTIESIRDKIKFKTGSRNLAGMALFALRNGLIRLQ